MGLHRIPFQLLAEMLRGDGDHGFGALAEAFAVPSAKPVAALPGCSDLRALLMTPASIRSTTPSGIISLWIPRSL